jgi:pSer/pThr/pTyr-binding forkhead associated (FHA) protein
MERALREIIGVSVPPPSTMPPSGPRLRATRGEVPVGEWRLDPSQPLHIGRSRQCDVVLEDDLISRTHLELRPVDGGGWETVDLGSTSGTWLGKKRISRHRLRSGDRLRVGAIELEVVGLPEVPPPFRASKPAPAPVRPTSTVVWSAVALVVSIAVLAGGGFLLARLRSRGAIAPVGAVKPTQPSSGYSEAAAHALLEPAPDGEPRRTPLGSFTTTAQGGRLDHALVTLELPAGALPEGSKVTVSRIDAAPAAMRDGFPVAQWGDFTPLSPILEVDSGADTLGKPATLSFPLEAGARFSSLAILSFNPKTSAWDSFPARFEPRSGRAVAEVGHLSFVHLLGLAADR